MSREVPGRARELSEPFFHRFAHDARDLVAIVGERYKEDVARFGYVFPANSSAPTMRT